MGRQAVEPPTPDEIRLAIARIEESRSTHVEWAEFQAAHPDDWMNLVDRSSPGGPEHHHRAIVEYDQVLDVLRRFLS